VCPANDDGVECPDRFQRFFVWGMRSGTYDIEFGTPTGRKSVPLEEWAKLPVDGDTQHDHYIHGTPGFTKLLRRTA